MKIQFHIISLLFIGILMNLVFGQTGAVPYGKVIESLPFKSEILGKDVFYSIYLPPDYDISKRSYPVVYLLHGGGGNETHWVQMCEANVTADRLIAERKIPHEFRIRDGFHYWEYWKENLDKGLIYIGEAFLHDD
jgi:enterochelin esterase-like enzyme